MASSTALTFAGPAAADFFLAVVFFLDVESSDWDMIVM
jgi:hypothetical protein